MNAPETTTPLDAPWRARYQIAPHVYVTCYLDVVAASASGLQVQVGVREKADTILPVGTTLDMTAAMPAEKDPLPPDQYAGYTVTITGVEVQNGLLVQSCSPLVRALRTDTRREYRRKGDFAVAFSEREAPFRAIGGTAGGLTLMETTSPGFVGLGPGTPYDMTIFHPEETFQVSAQVVNIQYDWLQTQHRLGVQLLNVTESAKARLIELLGPPPPGPKQATVDTEGARIRDKTSV